MSFTDDNTVVCTGDAALVKRRIAGGSFQIWIQCLTCGRHLDSALSQAVHRNWRNYPDSDPSIAARFCAPVNRGPTLALEAGRILGMDLFAGGEIPAMRDALKLRSAPLEDIGFHVAAHLHAPGENEACCSEARHRHHQPRGVEALNEHPCEVCGAAYAPFGYGPAGVSFTREPERFHWYCRAHWPDAEDRVAELQARLAAPAMCGMLEFTMTAWASKFRSS